MDRDVLRAQEALRRLYAGERQAPAEVPKERPRGWGGNRTDRSRGAATAEDLAQEQVGGHSSREGQERGAPWPGAATDLRFAPTVRHPKVGEGLAAARARLAEKEAKVMEAERRIKAHEELLKRHPPVSRPPETGPIPPDDPAPKPKPKNAALAKSAAPARPPYAEQPPAPAAPAKERPASRGSASRSSAGRASVAGPTAADLLQPAPQEPTVPTSAEAAAAVARLQADRVAVEARVERLQAERDASSLERLRAAREQDRDARDQRLRAAQQGAAPGLALSLQDTGAAGAEPARRVRPEALEAAGAEPARKVAESLTTGRAANALRNWDAPVAEELLRKPGKPPPPEPPPIVVPKEVPRDAYGAREHFRQHTGFGMPSDRPRRGWRCK